LILFDDVDNMLLICLLQSPNQHAYVVVRSVHVLKQLFIAFIDVGFATNLIALLSTQCFTTIQFVQ